MPAHRDYSARSEKTGFLIPLAGFPTSAQVLVLLVATLLVFGFVMLASTSQPQGERLYGNSWYFAQRQCVWLFLGLAAAIVGMFTDYHVWKKLAAPIFLVSLVLLAMVFFPPFGHEVNGSHRWIKIGRLLTFQPSEMAKFAAINMLSVWMAFHYQAGSGWKKEIIFPALALGPMLGLILCETDFGATSLIAATSVLILFAGGMRLRFLLSGAFIAISGIAGLVILNPNRMERITAFRHPEEYAQNEAYQLMNALHSFVLGGLGGVGLGQSMQKRFYLPEAHTDFIFAIIGEELGVGASILVVLLFIGITLCGLRIGGKAPDMYGRLMAFGITSLIAMQAVLNIAVVTGLLPTKGLPLPFISFGGTSLLMTLFMVGVLLNISRLPRKVLRRT